MDPLQSNAALAQYLIDTQGEEFASRFLKREGRQLPYGWVPDTKRALEFTNQRRMAQILDETRRHNMEQERLMGMQRLAQAMRPQDLYDIRQGDSGEYTYVPKDPRYGLPSRPVPAAGPGSEQLRRSPSLPQKTGDDLRDMSGQAQQALTQIDTFKPDFGGSFIMGDTENALKRMFPVLESLTGTQGQADWWSAMQQLDTLIRHPLFGSAFTPTEKGLWQQMTVSPRDDPAFIRRNVQRRAALLNTGVARAARGASQRYKPEEVLSQTGLPRIPDERFAAPIVGQDALDQRIQDMASMWQRPSLDQLLR